MVAYARAANITNNSVPSVRMWVRVENDDGMDALESKRDNCGTITRFSPSKKRCIDELMEECEGEPTERQVQEALGLGSHKTAGVYIVKAGYKAVTKRLAQFLTKEHAADRVQYCVDHFMDDWAGCCMADEKLFVLGLGKTWRYVKAEHDDQPCLKFVDNKLHPAQLMITAIVCRPDPAKGVSGKVAIFFSCAEEKPAERKSKNRPAGTMEIKTTGELDGPAYAKQMIEKGFPAIQEVARKLKRATAGMTLQDDNAPPHARAWNPDTEKGRNPGCDLGKDAARFGIKRQHQPARSPDLNVLDLYVWRVLEAGVHKRRPKTLMELWTAIQAAWDEDLTEAKLECAYRLLDPVMGMIAAHNGYNNFKLPHSGIREQMRADGWDI